jgi:hypothetical protein
VRRVFRTVVPVAGLLGIAAQRMPSEAFGPLSELAKVPPRRLADLMEDVSLFCGREYPQLPVPAGVRADLVDRMGAWGVFLACGCLRDGLGEDAVRRTLLERSGVLALRELVLRHFGNRAGLIKLDHGRREIADEVFRMRATAQLAGRPVPAAADRVAALLEELQVTDPGPAELAALGAYYNGGLDLTAEQEAQLLDTLLATARRHAAQWAGLCSDPLVDRPTLAVARAVLRTYERVADEIGRARELLYGVGDEGTGQ